MQNQNPKLKTELKYRCYYFSIEIIKFLERLPEKKVYWVISDQLLTEANEISKMLGSSLLTLKNKKL